MKLMVCYDGSELMKVVLSKAVAHAKAFNAEVLVVTSVPSAEKFYPDLMEPYEQGLKDAKDCFAENGVECETLISFRGMEEGAGEDLVRVASREGVSEIIIGITHRSILSKLLMGSVAQFVILRANCPVLGVGREDIQNPSVT